MTEARINEEALTAAFRVTADSSMDHSPLEWHILKTACPNVLVTGPTDAVERSLATLWPYLEQPVCCETPDTLLSSSGDVRTFVIRDVDRLSASQQRQLALWLERSAATRIRVVSTSAVSLFPLVAAGLFLEALYYRLNMLLLDAQPHSWRNDSAQPAATIDERAIAHRAFQLFRERGSLHGRDFDDWLQAEREVRARSATAWN
jgi:hypothetical protein